MQVDIYTLDGAKKSKVTLPKALFEQEVNGGLIHLALQRQLGNSRTDTAYTKTKGEVRGGGRKPWNQKGTGRARTGTIRNPHWRGGGVTFGPRAERNFSKRLPQKMRRTALLSALSAKAQDKAIFALEKFTEKTPKTKLIANLLIKMGDAKRTLIISDTVNINLQKSSNNLLKVKTITAQYLNIYDIINADRIIFLKDAFKVAEDIFAPKESSKK